MKKGQKHIIVFTPGFAKDETDKTCIPMLQDYLITYKSLYPKDLITIITFQYPFQKEEYTWNGIKVYSIGGNNNPFPLRLITWIKVMRVFKKIHTAQPAQILHSFWLSECALIGQRIARKYQIRHLATAMGQDCKPENWYLKFLNLKEIYTVCLSEFSVSNLYNSSGKHANEIILFGLTPQINPPVRARQIDILGVGSVIPVKNYGLFIEIIDVLVDEFPDLRCMIIGNQPDKDELDRVESKIKAAGLQSNIILKGKLEPEIVLDYMRRSKFFLHTSLYEGQGQVKLEALACGMHLVCFDVGHTHNQKSIICNTKMEMIVALRNLLLDKELSFKPIFYQTMAASADSYHHIYHTTDS